MTLFNRLIAFFHRGTCAFCDPFERHHSLVRIIFSNVHRCLRMSFALVGYRRKTRFYRRKGVGHRPLVIRLKVERSLKEYLISLREISNLNAMLSNEVTRVHVLRSEKRSLQQQLRRTKASLAKAANPTPSHKRPISTLKNRWYICYICESCFESLYRYRLDRLRDEAAKVNTALKDADLGSAAAAVITGEEKLLLVSNDEIMAESASTCPPHHSSKSQDCVLSDDDRRLKTVAILDKKVVSITALTALRKACPELPSERAIRSVRTELRHMYEEHFAVKGIDALDGWWVDPREMLTWLTDVREPHLSVESGHIDMVIQGDGRQIGRKHGSCLISFTILQEGRKVREVDHLYPIAIVGAKEVHSELKKVLSVLRPCFVSLRDNGLVTAAGRRCTVRLFLCADWKFIAVARGLPRPAADGQFCLFCSATRDDRRFPDRRWSIDENRFASLPNKRDEDLFDFIEICNTIPDCLHSFLRITDKLAQLVFGKHYSLYVSLF